MTPDKKFQHTVNLYRKLYRPSLSGSGFEGCAMVDNELQEHIQHIWKNQYDYPHIVGEFEVIQVGDNSFYYRECDGCPELPLGETVRIVFNLPGGDGRFYSDVCEYVGDSPSLPSGQPNPNVYLVKEDYLAGEKDKPESIQKLEAVRRLVALLTELSHFNAVDEKTNEPLIGFILRGKSQDFIDQFHLSINFSADILRHQAVDLHLLEEIVNESEEKKNIFRISLDDVLSKSTGSRKSLDNAISHWQDVNECYEKNCNLYHQSPQFGL